MIMCVLLCYPVSIYQQGVLFLVVNSTKYSHITPVRKTLHWLPIEHCSCRSTFKVVIQNILNLFLNLNILRTILVKDKRILFCSRYHTLPHQCISVQTILSQLRI